MLNFQPYQRTYVPEPIEQIGGMMRNLNENNRRVASAYEGLSNALSSFDVRPEDRGILADREQYLESSMDDIIKSENYNQIEGKLNRTMREFINEPLKASIARTADYNQFREEIKNQYDNKNLSYEQFQYYYNTPYTPTVEDENTGTFSREFENKAIPPARVDIDKMLKDMLSNIQTTTTQTGIPNVEYMTYGDLEKMGIDTRGMPPEAKTNHIKHIIQEGKRVRSPEKIKAVLTSMVMSNPDAMAYIEDLAKIRSNQQDIDSNPVSILDEWVNPYVVAGAIRDTMNRGQLGTGYASAQNMLNQEAEDVTIEQLPAVQLGEQSGREPWERSGFAKAIAGIANATIKPDSRWGKMFRVPKDGVSMLRGSHDEDATRELNFYSKMLYGKEYSELTNQEKLWAENQFGEMKKELVSTTLYNANIVRPTDSKVLEEKAKSTFGTKSIKINNSEIAEFSPPNRTYYDLSELRLISQEELRERIENVGKNTVLPINYLGGTEASLMGQITGDYSLAQFDMFKIGDLDLLVGAPKGQTGLNNRLQNTFTNIISMGDVHPGIEVGKGTQFHSKITNNGNEVTLINVQTGVRTTFDKTDSKQLIGGITNFWEEVSDKLSLEHTTEEKRHNKKD